MVLPAASRRIAILVLIIAGVAMGSYASGRLREAAPLSADDQPSSPVPVVPTTVSAPPPIPATTAAPAAPPTLIANLAALKSGKRPTALLEWAAQAADVEPALALLEARDARLRMAAVVVLQGLRQRPAVAQALERRRACEPDPRVRLALAAPNDLDRTPDWVINEPRITLPHATTHAPARSMDVMWDPEHGGGAPANRTTITIDSEGRAVVDTRSDDAENWHVRYAAWAWRDAQGNVVIDARNQVVEQVTAPAYARPLTWSPDSFIIAPDGQCRTVDDREQRCSGAAAMPGAG